MHTKQTLTFKALLLIFVAPLLIMSGCERRGLARFTMDYDATVTIPSQSVINLPFNLFTPDITTDAEATFSINDTRKELVNHIFLTSLQVTLTMPSQSDLSFLKSVRISIAANGLPDTEIAWKDNIPESVGKQLVLDMTGEDLQEYIKKDKFSLKTSVVTRKLIASDHHIDLKAMFQVEARIIP